MEREFCPIGLVDEEAQVSRLGKSPRLEGNELALKVRDVKARSLCNHTWRTPPLYMLSRQLNLMVSM